MIELEIYETINGRRPYEHWLQRVRDKMAVIRIFKRLRNVQLGNFGDHSPVGEGVLELRVHVGAGYRVYCARHGQRLVVLLCGGDKGSQAADIKSAQEYWADWKRRKDDA
jgi:putative addiction module killer protein